MLLNTQAIALTPLGGSPAVQGQFGTPLELNTIDMRRMIIGAANGIYESMDQGENIEQVPGPAGVNRNAMYYGHAGDPDFLVVGYDTRRVQISNDGFPSNRAAASSYLCRRRAEPPILELISA